MFRDLFTEEDDIVILELARRVLSDDMFSIIAEELDMSDKELRKLQLKIEKALE